MTDLLIVQVRRHIMVERIEINGARPAVVILYFTSASLLFRAAIFYIFTFRDSKGADPTTTYTRYIHACAICNLYLDYGRKTPRFTRNKLEMYYASRILRLSDKAPPSRTSVSGPPPACFWQFPDFSASSVVYIAQAF